MYYFCTVYGQRTIYKLSAITVPSMVLVIVASYSYNKAGLAFAISLDMSKQEIARINAELHTALSNPVALRKAPPSPVYLPGLSAPTSNVRAARGSLRALVGLERSK